MNMSVTSIALDVIVIIVLISSAIYYGKKGFISGLLQMLGTLASFVASYIIAAQLSMIAFNSLFRESLVQNTMGAVNEAGVNTVNDLLAKVIGFLPDSLIEEIAGSNGALILDANPEIANTIVDTIIGPILVPLISIIIFLVAFLLLRLILGMVTSLLRGLNKVPVVGAANRVLGVVMGVLIGCLYVLLIIGIIWLLDSVYGAQIVSGQFFADSVVYNLLKGLNVFI